MRGIGHALRVFFLDNDGAGLLGVWILAALVMWLGYRHSRPDYTRPEHRDQSIRRPPDTEESN